MVGKGTVNKRAVYATPLLAMQQMRESPQQDEKALSDKRRLQSNLGR